MAFAGAVVAAGGRRHRGGVIPALLINVTKGALPAVLALLGVILGGAIAAGTNIITAQAARRAQIVAATWPRRVEVHQAGF
jgi:hypothetical protein